MKIKKFKVAQKRSQTFLFFIFLFAFIAVLSYKVHASSLAVSPPKLVFEDILPFTTYENKFTIFNPNDFPINFQIKTNFPSLIFDPSTGLIKNNSKQGITALLNIQTAELNNLSMGAEGIYESIIIIQAQPDQSTSKITISPSVAIKAIIKLSKTNISVNPSNFFNSSNLQIEIPRDKQLNLSNQDIKNEAEENTMDNNNISNNDNIKSKPSQFLLTGFIIKKLKNFLTKENITPIFLGAGVSIIIAFYYFRYKSKKVIKSRGKQLR